MKNRIIVIYLCLGLLPMIMQAREVYFTSYPCISPDGKNVVFSYESDLWMVKSTGGMATRLTAMQGEEIRAKFSPDGKWIAFTGSQYGNQDVFIIPSTGGEVRQMTFHESFDHVDNWSWDSKNIYFTSSRYNRFSGYSISVDGGTPKRLFHDFFHTVHNLTPHPNGELYFSETSESKSQSYRKGYKGAYNPDIQSYNSTTGVFKKYTSWEGKDMWPTIDKSGNIYFVSDQKNGQYNLCSFDKGKSNFLTTFPTSIKYPVVSADGSFVVFEKDFQIFMYDTKSGKSNKIQIEANTNITIEKDRDFDVKDKISNFDVSEDGKKLSFVSRGMLFVSDIKGKFVKQIPTDSKGRVMEVKWTHDNKTLLYTKTNASGFTNLYTIRADSIDIEKQLTKTNQNDREITLNKERDKAVFLSGRNEVNLLDLKTKIQQVLVKEELWGFQNSTPSFSPNGEYVLFTAKRNFEEDIFVYHIAKKILTNVTNTGITENNPVWSPDGKFIYFTSNRYQPSYPFGQTDARVYRLPLQKFDLPYASDKYNQIFEEKAKDSAKKSDNILTTAQKDSIAQKESYTIDFDKIISRIQLVSPDFGTQGKAYVTQKDDKTWIIYSSNHDENTYHLWMTTYENFEKVKTEKIEGARTGSAFIIKSSDKLYALIGGNIHYLNVDSKKTEKIDISHTFRRSMRDEFQQMFAETWANVKENFYNETFHGLNWEAKRVQYQSYVPHVLSRSDLRELITELMGELNSSHTGFTTFGDEEKTFYKQNSIATGIVWDNDAPFTVDRIVTFGPTDKSSIDIRKGDILIAVDGIQVDKNMNREYYFVQPSQMDEITLTMKRGDAMYHVKIHPRSYNEINGLMYDEWIEENQKRVDQKSNKKIAYAYMKNMTGGELEKFLIDMTTEAYSRDGLILDLRYNTGGNVHDKVLQFLSQKPYLKWKYREGELTVQPNFTPAGKPIVLLTNEQSLSDAEMTTEGFKRLGLGKVIGTETYRWIIFTSGKGLVDGSFYRLPAWGCYTLDGKNLEQVGVAPDIFVPMDFKDRLDKKDPQLDRAISEILQQLK